MAQKKPRKRKPQKRGHKTANTVDMLQEIVSRPATVSDQAAMAAADQYDRAQEALEAGNGQAAAKAILGALDDNPRDIDSLLLFVELAVDEPSELLAALRIVENVARAELGERAFSEDRGHFWGLIETRPFMRVEARLVELLSASGETDAAITQCEEMLSLNPNDNQGMRDQLLGLYLANGQLDRADALLREYDDSSAVFAWGRVLLCLLEDRAPDAAEALKPAQEANRFVAPLLLGAFDMPAAMPGMYSPGGPNEAVIATDYLLDGWMQNDAAPLQWLAQQVWL